MGYVRETMLIVTGWQVSKVQELHSIALRIFGVDRLSRALNSDVNAVGYFFIGGAGSKRGWDDDKRHRANVAEFMANAQAMEHFCSVIVIESGEEPGDFDARRFAHADQGWGEL